MAKSRIIKVRKRRFKLAGGHMKKSDLTLKPKLIVSVTSYGKRLETLDICLKSLINQTQRADKIVVYLTNDLTEADLPSKLLDLKQFGVEFHFIDQDLRPHKKYYYAMQEYPDDLIVTVDDDVIYDQELLEILAATYLKFPQSIIAARAHQITFTEAGNFQPYNQWDWEATITNEPRMDLIATGAGGVLYPPYLLDYDFLLDLNEIQRYLTVDDLWLKAAEVQAQVPTVICDQKLEANRRGIPHTQAQGLFNHNVGQNENDIHLKDLDQRFKLAEKIRSYDNSQIADVAAKEN